jgi:ATP-dependent DNA helicase RecG
LVTQCEEESSARERLIAVAGTLDGFELSRIDLEQRREGDVLGANQSGTRSHLQLLRVLRDEALIEQARDDAESLIATDNDLSAYPLLKAELAQLQRDQAVDYLDKG